MFEKLRFWISNPSISSNYLRVCYNRDLINEYTLMTHAFSFEVPFSNTFLLDFNVIVNEKQEWPYVSRIEGFSKTKGYHSIHVKEFWRPSKDIKLTLPTVWLKFPIVEKKQIKFKFSLEQDQTGILSVEYNNERTNKYMFATWDSRINFGSYKQGVGILCKNDYFWQDLSSPDTEYNIVIVKSLHEIDLNKHKIVFIKNIGTVEDYDMLIQQAIRYSWIDGLEGDFDRRWLTSYKYIDED